LISFITTSKLYDDFEIPFNIFSEIGGIEVYDLVSLEKTFLEMIYYDLFIDDLDFVGYTKKVRAFYNKKMFH
jgi:hypothetical protein